MPANNEISIVFKAKTEEAASNIKKAAQNIEGLSVAGGKADSAMRKVGSSVAGAGDSAKKTSKSLGQIALEVNNTVDLVKKGLSGLKSAYSYLKEGADLLEAQHNFRSYTLSIGKDADELVARFRKATRNQISDVELMKSATKALRVAGINDIEALEKIYQIADTKGDLLGLSLQETFDKIVSAISSGNGKALNELGILPEKFSTVTNSADLLKNRTALLNEVIRQSKVDLDALSSVGETSSDKFNQFEASISNLNTELKKCLADGAEPIIDFLRDDGIPVIKSTIDLIKTEGVPVLKTFTGVLKDYYDWVSKGKFSGEFQGSKLGVQGVIEQKRLEIEDLKKWKSEVQKDFDYLDKQWWLGDYDNERFAKAYNAGNKFSGKSDALASIKAQLDTVDKLITDATNHLEKFKEEARTSIKVDQFTNYLKDLKKSTISGAESLFPHIFGKETVTELKTVSNSINNIDSKFSSIASKIDTLAKDKLPKLPETTSEMLDVSTEVLSVASLMPNYWFKTGENIDKVNKKLEEQNKLLAEKEFKKRSEEIGYWNSFIRADNKTQQNSLYNNFFKQAGVVMPSGIDYVKIINNATTRHDINETADYMQKQFTDGISNAIADGFASADFSGFASNLQSVISGVVGNGISTSLTDAFNKKSSGQLGGLFKEVVNDKGKVSLGNLGSNLLTGGLIGTATNFLFGEGGIFGKTKIVGKENLNKSAELNAQVDQAKELAESIYLATGISDATRELIDNAVYNKTWTTTHKSKNIFKKKKTITLHGAEQAQASIKYVEDLQKQALAEQAVNNYNNFMLGRDDSVGASYNNYLDAMKAYDASQVMTYSTEENAGFQSQIDARLAQISNLKNQKSKVNSNLNRELSRIEKRFGDQRNAQFLVNDAKNRASGQIRGINSQIDSLNSEISALREKLTAGYKYDLETRTEMLQQMEQAHVNYIKAQQDARSNLFSNFTGSTTMASLVGGESSQSLMDMLLGNKDVSGNSDMIQAMLPLLEESYTKDADLNKRLNSSDELVREAAVKEQQSIWEQASSVYEKMYKDAKNEALNTNLSTEEQSAAFERWQESFQAYLSLQEQIAENTKTIADLEESNALSKLSTELGDMLSIVAEIKNQKSTNNTLVFRQSVSVEEIIAKLKEIAGVKNPELASVFGEILNDRQNQSLWG